MDAIDTVFADRAALREGLLDTFVEGGLFVEGNYDVTSGSRVLVRVTAKGMRVGLFVEGVVQWRRVGVSRAPELTAGLGVRLLANQNERYRFLQRWAAGASEGSLRGTLRYPAEQRVYLSTRGRGTGRLMHATIHDVSNGGALIAVPANIVPGTPVALEYDVDGAHFAALGSIAWGDSSRIGFKLDDNANPSMHAGWQRLVGQATSAYDRRVVRPRRPTDPPIVRT